METHEMPPDPARLSCAPFALDIHPELPAVQPALRLHFVDGLRGLAMLMVLLYHCWLFGGQWRISVPIGAQTVNLAAVLGNGHIGVNLFLVLSGFCLYWPFTKSGRPEPTLWEFAKKRCRRILPPYYAVLVLCGGAALVQALRDHDPAAAHYTLNWLWMHALMAQNLRPGYVLTINGSLWSLALEFQLYILFPVLVAAFRRFSSRRVLWAVLAFCSAFRFIVARGQFVPDDNLGYVLAYSVFGRAFEFALGMLAAQLVARRQSERPLRLHPADYVLATAVIAIAVADGRHGHFRTLTDAMWGLLFGALLLAASRPGSLLHRMLSGRVLINLGIFSYSVYLIHLPLVIALGAAVERRHLSNAVEVAIQLLFVVPLVLGLGYLFHLLFEKPFMNAPKSRAPGSDTPPRWV